MKSSTATAKTLDPIIETLVRRRRQVGLPQQAVADLAGISRRALVSIEGGTDCTLSTLRALCRALDINLQTCGPGGASNSGPAPSFRSAAEMSSYQEERELAEAMRVQAMSPADLSAWLATGWDRLQKQADSLYAGVERPPTGPSRHFKTIADKNRFDEERELQFAVAVAMRNEQARPCRKEKTCCKPA